MPCPYKFKILLPPRIPLRNVISYSIKCRCRIQKPLRPKMCFEFRDQNIELRVALAREGNTMFVVRCDRRSRAKFRAGQTAKSRQCRPTDL